MTNYSGPFFTEKEVETFFQQYQQRIQKIKKILQRPLTLTEKILFTHLVGDFTSDLDQRSQHLPRRGKDTVTLRVDRVTMQDATAQMAMLQFMLTGRPTVAIPTTIHCDHLILAGVGAAPDVSTALTENNEVYTFLQTAANKYGIGFWQPGSGIIHQVMLENYVLPGQIIIGTDSHTPNAGGLSTLAIGVGGADAVDVMAGLPWNVQMPKIIGVQLTGKLQGWASPKDIILKVAEILTVKGGTGAVVEYFGEGVYSLSTTGKATITNMGAEVGATTSVFPYDSNAVVYLYATNRAVVAAMITKYKLEGELQADPEILQNPLNYYDELLSINLSQLEPHVTGPHTPDLSRPISQLKQQLLEQQWPSSLSAALIGSCTNSSYQDMSRAASIAQQAAQQGVRVKAPLLITPGSEQIHKTIQRDGQLKVFEEIGGIVLANACGPCIGQWNRQDIPAGVQNSIITSYNRNFKARNDANPQTHAFIASPEMVVAMALSGDLMFNPLVDELITKNGTTFCLQPPQGIDLPSQGFVFDRTGYIEPSGIGVVEINEQSERLAFLEPFGKPRLEEFQEMFVLLKAKGKCTTDHISPAGKWLRYRGHLDKISNNMFNGVTNFFQGEKEIGKGKNVFTRQLEELSKIAREYKARKKSWVIVGEENYGEGSSREHAAMEPRYLGCKVVVVKSFARIHETNLKMQGILALTFVHPQDYDKILEDDTITIKDLPLMVNQPVLLYVVHASGINEVIQTKHTLTSEQLEWFIAGSSLNWLREQNSL